MLNKYPDVLSIKEMAQALGVGRNSAYKLIKDNMIGHKKIGKRIIIPKVCVIEYLESARYGVKI